MITLKFASSLLVGSMYLFTSNILRADMLLQEIKNSTESVTANDLTLVFTQAIPRGTELKITNQQNMSMTFGIASDSTKVEFTSNQLPSTFGPGALAKIKFEAPAKTMIDKTKSFWTMDGAMIINGLASFGAPPTILFSDGLAFAEFTDTDDVPIVYTQISLYANNDLMNFNIDQFDTPTGDLVTGIPLMLSLNPGDTVMLPFGSVLPDGYELALATAAPLSDPSDTFSVGSAALVPEPSMFPLLGLCFLAVMSKRFFI
jgi:hypothetical protein